MAVTKSINVHTTFKCDKCGTVQEVDTPHDNVSVPPGWASIKVTGLPPPAVQDMQDALEGREQLDIDVSRLVRHWISEDQQRLCCDACLIDVWAAIGLPERQEMPMLVDTVGVKASARNRAMAAGNGAPMNPAEVAARLNLLGQAQQAGLDPSQIMKTPWVKPPRPPGILGQPVTEPVLPYPEPEPDPGTLGLQALNVFKKIVMGTHSK